MGKIIIKDNRISTIIKLSQRAFGQYKLQIFILTVLGFLNGILEGIGVNALIPLFSFIMGGDSGGNDVISRTIEKFFVYFHIDFNVEFLLIFICLLFILKAIVSVCFTYIMVKITTGYEEKTRRDLLAGTVKASWPHLLKQKIGYLENILMIDVQYSKSLFLSISGGIMSVTGLFIYAIVALNISVNITLLTFILGACMFLAFKPIMFKIRAVSRKIAGKNKEINHYVSENIIGMKTVKVMSIGDSVIKKGKEYFSELRKLYIKSSLLTHASGASFQPVALVFICGVIAFSYKSPDFNFAALVVVIYLIQKMFLQIKSVQLTFHKASEAVPYLSSVLNYQDRVSKNKKENRGARRFEFKDSLIFKDVIFSYNDKREILTDVNFIIKKGELVGLIGPSGAGKTTAVDLILRLFSPDKGVILLDGKNIAEFNIEEWRENIGYVSQDIFLMNDTIANNIKFYDNRVTEKGMVKAAKMANIYDFIQSCPDKFATALGERGVLLSAGQRQRIVIARVLARKPKIIILDEATSALDNESEVKIQKVINNLKGKITVFAIAHRLSTVINSDKLLILENGRIIEQGAPDKLLKDKKSYFYKVYNIRN